MHDICHLISRNPFGADSPVQSRAQCVSAGNSSPLREVEHRE